MRPSEHFIPCAVDELTERLASDPNLVDDSDGFRQFADKLIAYQRRCADLLAGPVKAAFAQIDPDSEFPPDPKADQAEITAEIAAGFERLCRAANFRAYNEQELAEAMATASLVPVVTQVAFNDFSRIQLFYRGDDFIDVEVPGRIGRRQVQVDNLRRVAMLLEVRQGRYFEALGVNAAQLGVQPGKTYLFLYKNIPRNDLELLFPNVKVSMTWVDRLLFWIPAGLGLAPLTLKVLPSLVLLLAAAAAMLAGPEAVRFFGVSVDQNLQLYPALAAASTLALLLGAFAMRQYSSFKHRRLRFLKRVTDTLFFKHLATNSAALSALADIAEQELIKELLLIFCILQASSTPLSRQELDARVESWVKQNLHLAVDFEVDKTLGNVAHLEGRDDNAGRLIGLDEEQRYWVKGWQDLSGALDELWRRSNQ
ncbi:MAG: DUF3754 domain-containing protein [Gammaproteobacteria bacterium]